MVICQNNNKIVVGDVVVVNGKVLPPCPGNGHNIFVVDNRVFMNGYEFVNGKWKRTVKALFHLLF